MIGGREGSGRAWRRRPRPGHPGAVATRRLQAKTTLALLEGAMKMMYLAKVKIGAALLAVSTVMNGASARAATPRVATDWSQVGANPQHTNFTPDSPAPPYKAAWVADFAPEQIFSAQPVIADGRVYQTTLQGNLYALDAASGKRLWYFKAGEVIWSGAAAGTKEYGGTGKVFVAAWDGLIFGLDAKNGKEIWKYDAGEPISGAPCVAEETIFIGTRGGTMLALTTDGKLKWKRTLSWHIYSTVAHHDGRVFAATEDMFVHCLDAKTGEPVWKSEKMHGLCVREFYPVIHKGKVFVGVTPAVWRYSINLGKGVTEKLSKPIKKGEKGYRHGGHGRSSLIRKGEIPPELEKSSKNLIQTYEKKPYLQTIYVLNERDGKQAYFAVHHYIGGLENVRMPPAACADGTIVAGCLFGRAGLGRINVEKNCWMDVLFELGGSNNDNAKFASVGGSRVFKKDFQYSSGVMDLTTREIFPLGGRRDRPNRTRVSHLPMKWMPGQAYRGRTSAGTCPASISGNRVFWMMGGHYGPWPRLIAYEEGR